MKKILEVSTLASTCRYWWDDHSHRPLTIDHWPASQFADTSSAGGPRRQRHPRYFHVGPAEGWCCRRPCCSKLNVSSPMEQNNNNNNNNAMNPQTSLSASATTTGGVADKRKLWRDSTTPTLTKEIMMLQQIIITTLLDYWNEWTKRNHHCRWIISKEEEDNRIFRGMRRDWHLGYVGIKRKMIIIIIKLPPLLLKPPLLLRIQIKT